MSRNEWVVTDQLLYHLSFTSELIGIRQEMIMQEACGLTLYEWRIMSVIFSFTPIASKDITRVTTLNKVAVSRAVANLIAKGLIEKKVSKTDSRMHYLSLTQAGRRRFVKARETFEQWSTALLGNLGSEEVKELKGLLLKIRKRLGEITDEERAHSEMLIFGRKS